MDESVEADRLRNLICWQKREKAGEDERKEGRLSIQGGREPVISSTTAVTFVQARVVDQAVSAIGIGLDVVVVVAYPVVLHMYITLFLNDCCDVATALPS